MRLPVSHVLPFAALVLVCGCAGAGQGRHAAPDSLARSGPAADYPVVIGATFAVDTVTYTPADTLNYDAVGQAAIGSEAGGAVSIAHKTLPLPSYIELTALDSGRTILARVERRGPMRSDRLVELSPGAAAQLGPAVHDGTPIRIRRVNPPEAERAMLRGGQGAPERMATPPGLLAVLKRKLDSQELRPVPAQVAPVATAVAPVAAAPVFAAAPPVFAAAPPARLAQPRTIAATQPAPQPSPGKALHPATSRALLVQIGTYANPQNAAATASKLGGKVKPSGRLSRVVVGPFAERGAAEAALAKARSAGYSDARIQRAD